MNAPRAGAAGSISAAGAVGWLIVASGLGRLAVARADGLCYGESYYFSCALHPSLSYFDHPPLSILLGSLSLWLGGEVGRLTLRWPFIALFAGTTWLTFLLGRRLFGPWAGFFAALLLNLSPVFALSVGIFFQPDGPLMFFWLACAWCLAHVLVGPPARRSLGWWAAAGAALGLAMLSKYPGVLLALGTGLYVLTRREQRHWLRHPGPYLALVIAALLFSPVVVWNAQHGWISFVFQSTRGMESPGGIRLDWLLRNVAGQSLVLLPWLWVAVMAELVLSFGSRPPEPARRFVAWLSLPPIALFTGIAAYSGTSQHHFHWATPGYLLLFLPLGDTVQRGLARGRAPHRWALGATAAVSLLVMTVLTTHVATGWVRGVPALLGTVARAEDPTLECIDFTGLEGAFAERGLLDRTDIFVFSDWWFRSGKVDYALKGRLPVLAFTRDNPRSFAFFDRSERWLGKDGILVTTKRSLPEVTGHFGRYFERITPMGTVDVGRSGRSELTLHLYRGERLTTPYPQPYGRAAADPQRRMACAARRAGVTPC